MGTIRPNAGGRFQLSRQHSEDKIVATAVKTTGKEIEPHVTEKTSVTPENEKRFQISRNKLEHKTDPEQEQETTLSPDIRGRAQFPRRHNGDRKLVPSVETTSKPVEKESITSN